MVLVDKTGTIVFMGHPRGRSNMEADIDKLRRGEALDSKVAVESKKGPWRIVWDHENMQHNLVAAVIMYALWYFVTNYFGLF